MKTVAQRLAWGRHLVSARCCHHDYPRHHQRDPGPAQRDLSLGLFVQTPPATRVAGGTRDFVTGRPLLRPPAERHWHRLSFGRPCRAQRELSLPLSLVPAGRMDTHGHTRVHMQREVLSSGLNFLVPASSGAPRGRRQHRKLGAWARAVSSEHPDHDWGLPRAQPAPVCPDTASVSES